MNKWTPDDIPCDYCAFDWIEDDFENILQSCIGTTVQPACGDGCCHERVECYFCKGTGIEN